MATANEPETLPASCVSLPSYTVPAIVHLTPPYPPSPLEAQCYYYGIFSQPRLVARSSVNVWVAPTGPEEYLLPMEASPVGLHPLQNVWEATVGPAMIEYLDSKGVKWTSLDPVRMGCAGQSSPPVIVWMGVIPGSLSAEDGVEVATHCKNILSTHDIGDVHVEIRESEVIRSVGPKMYRPVPTSDATAQVRGPFSTTLGFPICAEVTPNLQGSGGFFFLDPSNPSKIYLVTARHVVFHPDKNPNELYQYTNSSQQCRNVLLFSDAAIEKHITAIVTEIEDQHSTIEQLNARLEIAEKMDRRNMEAEKRQILPRLEEAKQATIDLKSFLEDISRDWKTRQNRILGHVVLSPPIGFNVGEDGFTEDWAVIEIAHSKVDISNFVGNALDLGTIVPANTIKSWMRPQPAHPPLFTYPGDRLLKCCGTISDDEMWKSHNNVPNIMVIKRGPTTGLTVGRLNTIRSFTKIYFNNQPGHISKEVTVLPRNSESGAFATYGDSGSAVVDGHGRFAGLVTGGTTSHPEIAPHCTYITSINFIIQRIMEYGLRADISTLTTLKQ